MRHNQLIKIIDNNIEIYINNIALELEQSHDHWFDDFGFPIFGQTSKEYHEQVYFESYFESYTRKLINSILKDICKDECADEIIWPESRYVGIYNGYTNVECEKEFCFEFINTDRKIGYRYTRVKLEEIDFLLKKETLKKLCWSSGKMKMILYVYPMMINLSKSFFYGICLSNCLMI